MGKEITAKFCRRNATAICGYVFYRTIKYALSKMLVRMLEEGKDDSCGIGILGKSQDGAAGFYACVHESLMLLKIDRPLEFRIVKKNILHIVFEPGNPRYDAKFLHSLCAIPWSNWSRYNEKVRAQIMAASIAHEAYRGECIKRYGLSVFENQSFEKKYRERAIRILLHYKKRADEECLYAYDKRIKELSTDVD